MTGPDPRAELARATDLSDADYRIEVTVGIDEVSLETGYKLSPRGEALLRRRSGVS